MALRDGGAYGADRDTDGEDDDEDGGYGGYG